MINQKKSPTSESKGVSINFANNYTKIDDAITDFKSAMLSAGLGIDDEIIADGQIHRFVAIGDKPNSPCAWYVFNSDEISAGVFGCWRRGITKKWCSKSSAEMSLSERQGHHQNMVKLRQQHQLEQAKRHTKARQSAISIWDRSFEVAAHPYLTKKMVKPYGIRQSGDSLIVPLRDVRGQLHSLQFIKPDGRKILLSGGVKKSHFHLIGDINQKKILVCEGYSTGATLYKCTGYATAVAIDAGNLETAGLSIREAYPNIKIIFCADNDQYSSANIGVMKATNAAKAVDGFIAIPQFKDLSTKPTDFNDLASLEGLANITEVAQ